ncbi:hypothetical protein [Variovorax sp. DT-64]|uniref:hypothetical protein n=1 Tax=Variovorax sp. DT-64 TaxID=3396160 RepID=UPI003F1CD31B
MIIGPLHEQAVQLTPRAARIAALLLVDDETVPPTLRRSLCIALSHCGMPEDTAPVLWAHDDPDAVAAQRFVAACVEVAARLPSSRKG